MSYFDHHLATFVSSAVIQEMRKIWAFEYASPLSAHSKGQALIREMENACQRIYAFCGANPRDWSLFVFPSHAEAIQQAFWSVYFEISRYSGRNHFLVSRFGEPSAQCFAHKLHDLGAHVTPLTPSAETGVVDPAALQEHYTIKTSLLSVSWAHGITGLIQPLESLAQFCKEKGILFHVDGSYIAGKIPLQLQERDIDFFSLNGEQIHGPKSGLLLVRKPLRLDPLVLHQKNDMPSDAALLIGMGEAAHEASSHRLEWSTEVARLRTRFEKQLESHLCKTLLTERKRLPNCSVVLFPHVHSELLAYELNQRGIFISPSPLLSDFLKTQRLLIQEPPGTVYSTLSFSFAYNQTRSEIDESCSILNQVVAQLRCLASC
ncbi:cysteine desulfurase family protein [Candidatus Similichlamydia laticola]|uniref:Cysteine desulfurase n=1 Tax=Candidatus Similichlamydia laticola TaxID=2170265 RepID=A0A369KH63_9BACT|nr:aminotransferase class V-fold PLP-dependent enzyme [Candidatus Similichlamydia laticola]RDB31133.1 Cysteine desulfurase [Candidatus Similichlamydia laticola]